MSKDYYVVLLIIMSSTFFCFGRGSLPFSKLTITSNEVECSPSSENKNLLSIVYKGNVQVLLADGSTISAKEMTALVYQSKKKNKSLLRAKKQQKGFIPSAIEKISLKGGVCVNSVHDTIRAQRAEVAAKNGTCTLYDDVSVTHKKKDDRDIPLTLHGNKARFDFETKKITFFGSDKKPITTVINLSDIKKKRRVNKE